MTPIHEAAYRGHNKLYQHLSGQSGADLTIKDRLGYTAADYLGNYTSKYPPSLPRP